MSASATGVNGGGGRDSIRSTGTLAVTGTVASVGVMLLVAALLGAGDEAAKAGCAATANSQHRIAYNRMP